MVFFYFLCCRQSRFIGWVGLHYFCWDRECDSVVGRNLFDKFSGFGIICDREVEWGGSFDLAYVCWERWLGGEEVIRKQFEDVVFSKLGDNFSEWNSRSSLVEWKEFADFVIKLLVGSG